MADLVVIEIVQEERYEEFVDFIYREFFPRERLAIASGLDRKPYLGLRHKYLQWLADGVSLVAIDRQTDRIVGAVFNLVLERWSVPLSPSDYDDMSPENRNIWTFLDLLEKDYNIFDNVSGQRGLELLFLCVQQSHCGLGLARQLTERTIQLATTSRMSFIKSNPSTAATCHLFESLGFQTIRQMAMVDYVIDAGAAFPHALPQDVARFVVKLL